METPSLTRWPHSFLIKVFHRSSLSYLRRSSTPSLASRWAQCCKTCREAYRRLLISCSLTRLRSHSKSENPVATGKTRMVRNLTWVNYHLSCKRWCRTRNFWQTCRAIRKCSRWLTRTHSWLSLSSVCSKASRTRMVVGNLSSLCLHPRPHNLARCAILPLWFNFRQSFAPTKALSLTFGHPLAHLACALNQLSKPIAGQTGTSISFSARSSVTLIAKLHQPSRCNLSHNSTSCFTVSKVLNSSVLMR